MVPEWVMGENVEFKIRIIAVVILGLFILIYQSAPQNLIEPNPTDVVSLSEIRMNPIPFRVLNFDLKRTKKIYLLNARNTATLGEKSLPEKKPYYYRVDLEKEKVDAIDYMEHLIPESERCVDPQKIISLRSILENGSICDSPEVEEPVKNIPCTMRYQLPYAILELDTGMRFHLGEKNTACDYPTRLCGITNDKLVEWTREFFEQIRTFRCQ